MPRIHRLQHIEGLGAAHFAEDDPVRPHAAVLKCGRRVDEPPIADARLPDGSRINVVIPPLALRGTMLSIRKFSREEITLEVRHIHVEHYQLRLYSWKQRKAFLAAGGAKNSIAGFAPNSLHQGDRIGGGIDEDDLGLTSSASRLICEKPIGSLAVLAIGRSMVGLLLGAAPPTARARPAMRLATCRDYAALKLLTA